MTPNGHNSSRRKLIYDPAKIREARCDAGLSGKELAAMIHRHESLISLVEKGKRQSPEAISLIAKALKKRPQDFHFDKVAA